MLVPPLDVLLAGLAVSFASRSTYPLALDKDGLERTRVLLHAPVPRDVRGAEHAAEQEREE
jgi:hypothetical protein